MARRAISSRSAAAKRAAAAKAARDAERRDHESAIQSALTDYYQASAEAERIREAGRRRLDGIAATIERNASEPDAAARDAVRRLRDLVGNAAEVARLCQLSVGTVREILAAPATGAHTAETTAGGSGQAPERGRDGGEGRG